MDRTPLFVLNGAKAPGNTMGLLSSGAKSAAEFL
jgi:hypothetical protein